MDFVGICFFNEKHISNPQQKDWTGEPFGARGGKSDWKQSKTLRKGADNRVLNGAIHFVTLVNGGKVKWSRRYLWPMRLHTLETFSEWIFSGNSRHLFDILSGGLFSNITKCSAI